ncbi:MAG: sugar phosphate isomerase/epimerase family protein [Planctomycetota bacterium]
MIPAISQVCSLHSTFQRDIEDYSAGKCPAVEIWFTKLQQYLTDHSLDDVRRLLDENQMAVAAASFQGGILTTQGEARAEAWKLFRERLDLCQKLNIKTIVVAADVPAPLTQEAIDRTTVSLTEAASEAGRRELRIALEFQAKSAFITNLRTAVAIVEDIGSPHLGICLDVFHFEVGSSKLTDLGYLTKQNLFHVQLSDLADVPRELAMDADRILPGEGDIPNATIVEHLKQIEYAGYVSIEVMNPQLWQVPPLEFGEIGTTALRRLLGQNESS